VWEWAASPVHAEGSSAIAGIAPRPIGAAQPLPRLTLWIDLKLADPAIGSQHPGLMRFWPCPPYALRFSL